MPDFTDFFIVNDDGYPELRHLPSVVDEDGCLIQFVEAGTSLDELVYAAQGHLCTNRTPNDVSTE